MTLFIWGRKKGNNYFFKLLHLRKFEHCCLKYLTYV